MSESIFKIREKTVILYGPLNTLGQSIGSLLLEHGADVAFVDEKASDFQRFINSLMDMRHVHGHYGRAAAIDCKIDQRKDAKDAVSRAAELFGSVDILIDVDLFGRDFSEDENRTSLMADEAFEFLKGRGKGRLLYLMEDDQYCDFDEVKSIPTNNKKLANLIEEKSRAVEAKTITANGIRVALNDEFLLKVNPEKAIKANFDDIKKKHPQARMTEPIDIAYLVAFMASPISISLNGQILNATY